MSLNCSSENVDDALRGRECNSCSLDESGLGLMRWRVLGGGSNGGDERDGFMAAGLLFDPTDLIPLVVGLGFWIIPASFNLLRSFNVVSSLYPCDFPESCVECVVVAILSIE